VCLCLNRTSCARGDTICPRPLYAGRCGSDDAAQQQPIPYACGAQRALLPIAVGAMNINDLMNINDVRESATIFPCPCKLTFDLLTFKVVSESRVTWATCVPILVFLGLAVLELFPMYATDVRRQTDRQTDVRQKHRLMPPLIRGGALKANICGPISIGFLDRQAVGGRPPRYASAPLLPHGRRSASRRRADGNVAAVSHDQHVPTPTAAAA